MPKPIDWDAPCIHGHTDGRLKDGRCRGCNRLRNILTREKYGKEYFNTAGQKCRKAHKLAAIEYLGGKCVRCGLVDDDCVYDFHHLRDKDKTLNKLFNHNWNDIELELQKCILLCANCHRKEHKKKVKHDDKHNN